MKMKMKMNEQNLTEPNRTEPNQTRPNKKETKYQQNEIHTYSMCKYLNVNMRDSEWTLTCHSQREISCFDACKKTIFNISRQSFRENINIQQKKMFGLTFSVANLVDCNEQHGNSNSN